MQRFAALYAQLDRTASTVATRLWECQLGTASMSPRLMSISSSSVSVTDIGANAMSRSPS